MFSRIRANPNARRSVWMILGGGMLSRQALERELRRAHPAPHVLQPDPFQRILDGPRLIGAFPPIFVAPYKQKLIGSALCCEPLAEIHSTCLQYDCARSGLSDIYSQGLCAGVEVRNPSLGQLAVSRPR
jgi:hypothetical protein